MTEQERMKQGYIWEDDEENLALQTKCKALVQKFNEMPTEAMAEREALLHDIFGKVGENVWLNSPLSATIGKYVTIGSGTYANMNLTLIDDWKKHTDWSQCYVMYHRASNSSFASHGWNVFFSNYNW